MKASREATDTKLTEIQAFEPNNESGRGKNETEFRLEVVL